MRRSRNVGKERLAGRSNGDASPIEVEKKRKKKQENKERKTNDDTGLVARFAELNAGFRRVLIGGHADRRALQAV
jgi:hypothetical protein